MQIYSLDIKGFRGILSSKLFFDEHTVLVGDNNTGKSTVLEAIDLVLGPERLFKKPIIDEHDFYAGEYTDSDGNSKEISVEVIIGNLSADQLAHFQDHIEWWNKNNKTLITEPPVEQVDAIETMPVLRVLFKGKYDKEEDDFIGETFFASPPALDNGDLQKFGSKDKRLCGFLILRTVRTGSRALSLERGSLLDVILRLKEQRPQMWESILKQLRELDIVESEGAPIGNILKDVKEALNAFIAKDSGETPHMRVTDLTRESLRKVLTVFIGTGVKNSEGIEYAAPYQHQGTGTINALVLAMLSMIANLKQNVIFAMEEPEIAIPPHTQKRIINLIRSQSAQAIFTSHSPYVLEEFDPKNILALTKENGIVNGIPADISELTKKKNFRLEFRKKYSEALLARRVLIVEGRTEFDALPAASRKLNQIDEKRFKTLEAMGIAIIDAEGDSNIAPLATLLKKLGKKTYGVYDLQEDPQKTKILTALDVACESAESSFEKLLVSESDETNLKKFSLKLVTDGEWPTHITPKPTAALPVDQIKDVMKKFFEHTKGSGTAADFIMTCDEAQIPQYIKESLLSIQNHIFPESQGKSEQAAPLSHNPLDIL